MFHPSKFVHEYKIWVVIVEICIIKYSQSNFVFKGEYQSCDWETYSGAHLGTTMPFLSDLCDHVITIDNPKWNDQPTQPFTLPRLSNNFCKNLLVKLTLFSADTVLFLLYTFGFEETNYFIEVVQFDDFVAGRFNYLFQQLYSYTSFIHVIIQTGEFKLNYIPDFGLTTTKEPFSNFINY